MALINCPECKKEISDKATSCPNCGNPMDIVKASKQKIEEYLACPKYKSKQLHTDKTGFSGQKAVAGAVLTGGIGLLAGTIGSNKIKITCLQCGNSFKAGEALIVKKNITNPDLDRRILAEYRKENNRMAAVNLYMKETNQDLNESATYVNKLLIDNIPPDTPKVGCILMLIALVSIGTLYTFLLV